MSLEWECRSRNQLVDQQKLRKMPEVPFPDHSGRVVFLLQHLRNRRSATALRRIREKDNASADVQYGFDMSGKQAGMTLRTGDAVELGPLRPSIHHLIKIWRLDTWIPKLTDHCIRDHRRR